jgi:hypothetical protein
MSREPEITIDALLLELNKARDERHGGATFDDIRDATGMATNKLRRLLKDAIVAGHVEAYTERRVCVMRPGWHYAANCFRVRK